MNRNVLFKYRQYLMKMHNNLPIAKANSIWEWKSSIFPIFFQFMNSNRFNLQAGHVPVAKQTSLVYLWRLGAASGGFFCFGFGLCLLFFSFERILCQKKLLAWNGNTLELIWVGQNIVTLWKTSHASEQGRSETSFMSLPRHQWLRLQRHVQLFWLSLVERWRYHCAVRLAEVAHEEARSLFCLWHLPTATR